MPRYNIALIPLPPYRPYFIERAALFRETDPTYCIDYLLSENSLPHITLAQFRTEDESVLAKIWQEVNLLFDSSAPLIIQLNGPEWIYDFKRRNSIWIQLMPLLEFTAHLQQLHRNILEIMEKYNLVCITRSRDQYEPHLTLVHTSNINHKNNLQAHQIETTAPFKPALGLSDEIGQLIKIEKG